MTLLSDTIHCRISCCITNCEYVLRVSSCGQVARLGYPEQERNSPCHRLDVHVFLPWNRTGRYLHIYTCTCTIYIYAYKPVVYLYKPVVSYGT